MMFANPNPTPDGSGNWGCGAYCGSNWLMLPWVGIITELHITAKELVPIITAAGIWGQLWRGKTS